MTFNNIILNYIINQIKKDLLKKLKNVFPHLVNMRKIRFHSRGKFENSL